ncbi:glycosyltransferase family 4 protein [bacterium]|nr:glycosyltransferase family 4 protein [bacterium]
MKVGFDLSSLVYNRGVSRYSENLFVALSQLLDVELFAYGSSGRGMNMLHSQLDHLRSRLSADEQKVFDQNLRLQRLPPQLNHWCWHYWHCNQVKALMSEIEVFHSWDYLQPPDKDLPLVSTIHDLAMLKYPHTANRKVLLHHQESWQILKQRKAHIIAVSEATRQDVIELLGFPAERVHLVYEALPTNSVLPPEELTEENFTKVKVKYGLERDYVLFVGTREPRKNLKRLVEAWWPLREEIDLVLVGASGWQEPKYKHPHLRVLTDVDNHDLGLLYHLAKMLVYPSLDEGFGLPILESFAYGTPVVTSKGVATQEVAGKAAELVDPYEVEEITGAMRTLLGENEHEQATRYRLMQKQLSKFSWEKAARETKAVYQQAIQERA